jgi:hypothetical protein
MNEIGEVIEIKAASCREFDLNEIAHYIRNYSTGGYPLSWSWDYNNPTIVIKNKALRFTVSGHLHNGHVYIVLNGLDYFDAYYTSNRGTIKKISKDIFVGDLPEILDIDIERIPIYKH